MTALRANFETYAPDKCFTTAAGWDPVSGVGGAYASHFVANAIKWTNPATPVPTPAPSTAAPPTAAPPTAAPPTTVGPNGETPPPIVIHYNVTYNVTGRAPKKHSDLGHKIVVGVIVTLVIGAVLTVIVVIIFKRRHARRADEIVRQAQGELGMHHIQNAQMAPQGGQFQQQGQYQQVSPVQESPYQPLQR
jgi:hypothetical protein